MKYPVVKNVLNDCKMFVYNKTVNDKCKLGINSPLCRGPSIKNLYPFLQKIFNLNIELS